ncbi:hypothetical protein EJ03DRAFT_383929 [Teratosphaeria nubilosa]|uniref:DUF7820 domain-containing protein n=1 Tax=Teratosphaeria nubilosa TaxID=161662 RepID=A0A6G1L4H8_9PEZI|nr:hypothetical protein EJ03DRAFT_383929 [Teratosphaeria nubilosa]
MERRSLLDEDLREGENVFGDEFEADDFGMVADGFRPSDHDREGEDVGEREHHDEGQVDGHPIRSVSAYYADSPVTAATSPRLSRSSMLKSRSGLGGSGTGVVADNPFADPDGNDERAPSMTFEPEFAGHRSVSSASSHQFARTSSQRFASGPSHPYGMYPQSTMARTSSIATQSTARPMHRQSSSSRHNGPAHPYTLYPQGVDEDIADEEDEIRANPVPVGFPGLGQSYQRRLGPDGEEQDIIGEDGHTEQLPPYSRYPEDGPEKMPLLVPEAPRALHSRAPVAGTDPTMSLMHNTLQPTQTPQPELQSMSDASTLREIRTRSTADNEPLIENSVASKKSWSEKSWKEKRKHKFCGIPFWWYLLALAVLVFIAAVLGGVIGGFVGNASRHKTPWSQAAKSSLYDASSIATPSQAPVTGTYQLSLSTPQATQASCLTQSNQAAAWSCELAGPPAEAISIGTPPNSDELGAFIFYASSDESIQYGTQASFMETTFAPFEAVQDNDDPASGPAYYFSQFYDKLVVVPEDALTATTSKSKRDITLDMEMFKQRTIARAGDKPWFCVWNNTFLEGFVYVERPVVSTYSPTNTSTPSIMSATPPATPTDTPTSTSATVGSSSYPTDFLTTATVTLPSSTATFTGPASAVAAWQSHEAVVESFANGNQKAETNAHSKRQVGANGIYDSLTLYPYVVKLEERRLPGNTVSPYCQQYQILNDGGYNWVPDSNGNPIIVSLQESDPSYGAYESAGIAGSKAKLRRDSVGGCHCQWISGQA